MSTRKSYPSDLTAAQWRYLKPLIPQPKKGGRPAQYPRREIVNAVLYLLRTGCSWRQLPHDLPPWRITFHYFSLWKKEGTWKKTHDRLRGDVRQRAGRQRQPSAGVIDSQSVKTTEKGGFVVTMQGRRSKVGSDISLSM